MTPHLDVVKMSKDSIWVHAVQALGGQSWPTYGSAHAQFRNTAGALLADIDASEITPEQIRFLAQPEEVNHIPAGAKFAIFINLDEGPMMVRHGTVMRVEPQFFDAPPSTVNEQRIFEDTFQRSALGWRWEKVASSVRINANGADPNGIGPNIGLFKRRWAAIRFYKQLAKDSCKITVTARNYGGSDGNNSVLFCADQSFTSGLALQFDTFSGNGLRIARLTGPTTVQALSPDLEGWIASTQKTVTILYNNLDDLVQVYEGSDPEPILEWEDTAHVIPHGNGYRHLGFQFRPGGSDISPTEGTQFTGWAARDEV
jgi:hypothetical protein